MLIQFCVCSWVFVSLTQAGQDFHADLYPDTMGQTAAMTAGEWWGGENKQVRPKHLKFMWIVN